MARFYPSNSISSSGITSDDVTITSLDVPESKTALTSDSEDKAIKGKLKEVTTSAEAVSSVDVENNRVQLTIPTRGLYSTSAKLFSSFLNIANAIGLTSNKVPQGESVLGVTGTYKGVGDATQADVRTGRTFSTAELSDAPGTMAEHAGGTFKPGTSDKTIISKDRYLTGDVVIKGDPNLIAANIRKNVVIFGIKGTSDGWVPEELDLYNAGNNAFRFSINQPTVATFESDHIHIARQYDKMVYFTAGVNIDLFKFTKLNFEYTAISHATSSNHLWFVVDMKESPTGGGLTRIGQVAASASVGSRKSAYIDVSNITDGFNAKGYLAFTVNNDTSSTATTSEAKIHRIWLSMD